MSDKLNPFNLLVYIGFFLYDVYGFILTTFFVVWLYVCSGLIIWLVIALFLPDINFLEHITMLMNVIIIDPALVVFNYFYESAETIRVAYLIPETNGIMKTTYLLFWLFLIGISLVCAPLIWFGWMVFTYFGFVCLLSGEAQALFMGVSMSVKGSASSRNLNHLFMGRTSYAEIYDADVKANAIVEAFERKTK